MIYSSSGSGRAVTGYRLEVFRLVGISPMGLQSSHPSIGGEPFLRAVSIGSCWVAAGVDADFGERILYRACDHLARARLGREELTPVGGLRKERWVQWAGSGGPKAL